MLCSCTNPTDGQHIHKKNNQITLHLRLDKLNSRFANNAEHPICLERERKKNIRAMEC